MALKLWRRSKGANWTLRGTVAGREIHKSTGTRDRRLAEAQRVRLEAELQERRAFGLAATYTLAEAIADYIEAGRPTRFLAAILEYAGPDTLLRDVNNQWVKEAAEAMYPGRAPATIDRQLISPVSAVVNMAAEDDLCNFRRFRKRAKDRRRMRWITPEEAESLLNAIAELHPHILRPVALMLGGGLRSSEALRVEVRHLRSETGEVWLDETKNGEPRMTRLPRRALDMILRGGLPEDGRVCLTPKGKPYVVEPERGGQIAHAFNACAEAAGLGRDVTPHVCRHTWATWFHASTRDFGLLMDLGGWKSPGMANRYRKLAPEDLSERLRAHRWDFTREDFQTRNPADLRIIK